MKRVPPRYLPALLAVLLLGVILIASPEAVERFYSHGLYPLVARVLGTVSDLVPFSLAEVLAILLIARGLHVLVRGAYRLLRRKTTVGEALRRVGLNLLIGIPVVFLSFELLWGINYGREPLETKTGFDESRIDRERFRQVLDHLARSADWDRPPGEMAVTDRTLAAVADGVDVAVERAEGTAIRCARRPKTLLANFLFRWTGIQGITIPFTHEATYRSDLFPYEIPFTAAHERAHLMGYGSEAEASFIGYAGCLKSADPLARYAGRIGLLRYFLAAATKEEREEVAGILSDEVKADLNAIAHRERTESRPLADLARRINDLYLKANRVEGGVRDYGRVVRLVLGADPVLWDR